MSITVGRNQPCPCNSGNKYKRCCGAQKANVSSAAPMALLSGTPAIEEQRQQRIARLLAAYKERPSHLLLNELMGMLTAHELIDQLLRISVTVRLPTVFQQLAVLLLDEHRFMEAAYFCRCWCKYEPGVDSLRLLGIIALHQNDLLTLNEVCGRLSEISAPPHILRAIFTGALFCAKRLSEAVISAKELLALPAQDPFFPMLALHIAYHAEDVDLLCEVIVKTKISSEINSESHLWKRIEILIKQNFLKLLHERSLEDE